MSSLRPAKIAAAIVRLIDGSLAEVEPSAAAPCHCPRCEAAWLRNRWPKAQVAKLGPPRMRLG